MAHKCASLEMADFDDKATKKLLTKLICKTLEDAQTVADLSVEFENRSAGQESQRAKALLDLVAKAIELNGRKDIKAVH
jgi:uncharacterized protein YecE (DUF72 family)